MCIIEQMQTDDIPCAMAIWHEQFTKYCKPGSFPDFWPGGQQTVQSYLSLQIEKGNAIAAKAENKMVGFMAWMYFDFHNERTAFCPIIGHATLADEEENIYQTLYATAARTWVQDNRFNHLFMTFYDDTLLRDTLYDIGFGSYVMDACHNASQNALKTNSHCKITTAVSADADILLELANETHDYYLDTPIFLKRAGYAKHDIAQIISNSTVFLAWENDALIGAMCVNLNQDYHFEILTTAGESAYIDDIGAYIKPGYRGKGVGKQLLSSVFHYCAEMGKPFVHVSFETANPFANKFWPKYFKPVIRSVRRTINKDANDRGY